MLLLILRFYDARLMAFLKKGRCDICIYAYRLRQNVHRLRQNKRSVLDRILARSLDFFPQTSHGVR